LLICINRFQGIPLVAGNVNITHIISPSWQDKDITNIAVWQSMGAGQFTANNSPVAKLASTQSVA
jgi:hypothetical protein